MSTLVIPLEASSIPEKDRMQQRVKVAVQQGDQLRSEIVSLEGGKAEVKLEVDRKLPVSVAVGPERTADEDLFRLQTLTAAVSPRQWAAGEQFALAPLTVTAAWWSKWLLWCREFVITGHLRCADGSPVPGAEVRAYDVDYLWWWSSLNQVGQPAITDATGWFSIRFTWCCGWWPWWWWRLREWRLEPELVEKIQPVLELHPTLRALRPGPLPAFDLAALNPQPEPPGALRSAKTAAARLTAQLEAGRRIEPHQLPALRERLTQLLPKVPELERLCIWPWCPWTPWFECAPDIIFRATQNCGGQTRLVLEQRIFDALPDIQPRLDVSLVANQEACCIPPPGNEPVGDCFLFTAACSVDPPNIGRTGATAGYAYPGQSDRPFSEAISLSGQLGSSAQADYYEVQVAPHHEPAPGASDWQSLPAGALQSVYREYFDATLAWPHQFIWVMFPVQTFGTRHLYESRHHYEQAHPPANWGQPMSGRSWTGNVDLIASVQTQGILADGAYDFRVIGYTALADGTTPDLEHAHTLAGCGGDGNNLLVLRIDNRVVGASSPNTVHVNTDEPDCGITAVRIGGDGVAACDSKLLNTVVPLDIDFFVHDPDGHLDYYELTMKYDLDTITYLVHPTNPTPGHTLIPSVAGDQVGPSYADAMSANPTARPSWIGSAPGGRFTWHMDNATLVFPKTCCYLLELTVYKRNIVGCTGGPYYNQSHYSFTVTR